MITKYFFFQITAYVFDDANPENQIFTNLTITVKRNENQPRFERSEYTTNALEITPIGTSLVQLTATDRDQDELEYFVMGNSDPKFVDYFYLNPIDGLVTLAKPLTEAVADELIVSINLYLK